MKHTKRARRRIKRRRQKWMERRPAWQERWVRSHQELCKILGQTPLSRVAELYFAKGVMWP